MKKLFENWRHFINEKKVTHSWATHGHRRSDENKKIGEVINHSLTESGKIEFYEVKFGNITEVLAAEEFIPTEGRLHEHEPRELKEQWPGNDPPGQGVGPGLPIEAGAANQYIDESWPDS